MFIIIYIFVLFIFFISLYIFLQPKLICMNKNDFDSMIYTTDFFDNMNALDLKARNVTTVTEYRDIYKSSFMNFTCTDINLLLKILDIIYKMKKDIKIKDWKFAKVSNNVENGYPHTLNNAIILPEHFFINNNIINKAKTVLHERVHIYQRYNYNMFHPYYEKLGFDKTRNEIVKQFQDKTRNNPDNNNIWFTYNKSYAVFQLYNSNNPKTLSDSKAIAFDLKNNKVIDATILFPEYMTQIENPNEISAILISDIIFKKYIDDKWYNITKIWISKYL